METQPKQGVFAGVPLFPLIQKHLMDLSLVAIIVLLGALFSILNPDFIGIGNIMNIVRQSSVICIVAIGMTVVMITGGLDLSVGSSIALGGAIGAIVLAATGNGAIGIVAIVFSCGIIGLINGLMIGVYNINPMMTTLATMALARGLTLGSSHATSVAVSNGAVNWLGGGQLGPIPAALLVIVVLYAVFYLIFKRTTFGTYIYAIGGNKMAARASGVKTRRVVMLTYTLLGLLVGVASIITVGRLQSAQPWAGLGLEFDVITAVVIGGTSLMGGEGNLVGTLLGAIVMGILTNGLAFMDLSPFYQYIIRGVLILGVVYIDSFLHRQRAA